MSSGNDNDDGHHHYHRTLDQECRPPGTTFSSKNAVQDVVLGCTMKKILLVLYKAPPLRDNAMTLKEITSQVEGSSLGYRKDTYDKSIRKLRRLQLVETLRFPGHRDFYYRLTKDGIVATYDLRRSFESQVQEITILL